MSGFSFYFDFDLTAGKTNFTVRFMGHLPTYN